MLHTSRTNPSQMQRDRLPELLDGRPSWPRWKPATASTTCTPLVLDNIEHLGIDALIPIGGDDTLSLCRGAATGGLPGHRHPQDDGQRRVGHRLLHRLLHRHHPRRGGHHRQRTTLGSHERIGVFRIFGRDAGFSALYAAYVVSGRCVIPEAPFELDKLLDVLIEDKRANVSRYAFVIASEGAMWTGGALGEFGEPDATATDARLTLVSPWQKRSRSAPARRP